jgi:hypothetical protein
VYWPETIDCVLMLDVDDTTNPSPELPKQVHKCSIYIVYPANRTIAEWK